MKSFLKTVFSCVLILCASIFLCACDISIDTDSPTVNYEVSAMDLYELACENGFEGTVEDWLKSLKGEDGKDGKDGTNGIDGKDGVDGKDGTDGINGTNGINGRNGQDLTARSLFELAVEYGLYDDSAEGYSKFLSDYLTKNTSYDTAYVASKCLHQVVSIYCETSNGVDAGSGVFYRIYDDFCYIITNYHVIADSVTTTENNVSTITYTECENIYLYLYGETSLSGNSTDGYDFGNQYFKATYVGGSANYDLAVLKVSGNEFEKIKDKDISEISFADTNFIQLGTPAIAIGNALGAGIAVTSGVVSCDSEFVSVAISGALRTVRCLRIDTSTNGGNSGGGVFNVDGELIGIVNAKKADTATNNFGVITLNTYDGVNYCLPASNIKNVVENILYFYETNYDESAEDNSVGVYKFLIGITLGIENSKNVYDSTTAENKLYEDTVVTAINETPEGGTPCIAAQIGMEVDDVIKQVKVKHTETVEGLDQVTNKTYDISRRFYLLDSMLTLRPNDEVTYVVSRQVENEDGSIEIVEIELDSFVVTIDGYAIFKGPSI